MFIEKEQQTERTQSLRQVTCLKTGCCFKIHACVFCVIWSICSIEQLTGRTVFEDLGVECVNSVS